MRAFSVGFARKVTFGFAYLPLLLTALLVSNNSSVSASTATAAHAAAQADATGTHQVAAKSKAKAKPKAAPIACRSAVAKPGGPGSLYGYNAKQLGHAVTIYNQAKAMKLPRQAAIIALSTAMQESQLKNLANTNVPDSLKLANEGAGHDYDSVGLFQQRPLPPWGNGSWGTPRELMTPQTSAKKFYDALKGIGGWQNLPVTVAAQEVQGSAFPDAYADDEGTARAMVWSVEHHMLACSG